jgi:hypothetical protein
VNAVEINRTVIQRYFDEGWNQGRIEVFDEIIDPQYVDRTPILPNLGTGPGSVKPLVVMLRRAFPDLKIVIEDRVVTEHKAATRYTLYGTHQGDFFGFPPTGKRVAVKHFQIDRFVNGKIVEQWHLSDGLGLLRQLGKLI